MVRPFFFDFWVDGDTKNRDILKDLLVKNKKTSYVLTSLFSLRIITYVLFCWKHKQCFLHVSLSCLSNLLLKILATNSLFKKNSKLIKYHSCLASFRILKICNSAGNKASIVSAAPFVEPGTPISNVSPLTPAILLLSIE